MSTSDSVRVGLSWLATYGLHSTLFLGGAWLFCRVCPPRLDRNRERLWKLALVGGILSSSLQLALGARPPLGSFELAAHDAAPLDVSHGAEPLTDEPLIDERSAALDPAALEAMEPARLEPRATEVAPAALSALRDVERSAARPPRTERAESPSSSRAGERPRATRDESRRSEPVRERSAERSAPVLASTGDHGDERAARPAELASAATSTVRSAGGNPGRWPGLVLGAWAAAGAFALLALAASWTCLRRRMLGREILRDGPLFERFERVRERARVRARVRLSVSDRVAAPFSTGLLRPEVCVPRAVLTLSGAKQDALLAHELAHLVRRDPAWFGLGFVIEKLFFFQPLNRVARRQLSELAEVACDDWAVRWTGARLALASCLTEVAGWVLAERPRLVTPPGLAGHRSRLSQRVQRLLDDRRSPAGDPPARWWPPLAAGALGLVALTGPGVSAARARAPSTPREPAAAPRPAATTSPATTASTTAPQPASTEPAAPPSLEPAPAQPASPAAAASLDAERSVLATELDHLERELAELHAELEAHALRERFEEPLARIDARMAELRAQHRRASELLALLESLRAPSPTNTAASAPASDAGAPAHDERTAGESR